MSDTVQLRPRPVIVVVVYGPDATSFLQSLLSQDLDPVAVGASAHALLLQPQGKLIVDVYAPARRRRRVVVRAAKAVRRGAGRRAEPVQDPREGRGRRTHRTFAVLAVRGRDARRDTSRGGADAAFVLPVDWDDEDAVDIVGPRADLDGVRSACVPQASPSVDATRTRSRASRRACRGSASTSTSARSRRRRSSSSDAVSFTKGCFVGQELVCRIDTRGHVNRYLRRVTTPDATPPPGAEVVVGDKVVGALTSAAGSRRARRWCAARSNRPPTCSCGGRAREAPGRVEAL